MTLDEAIKYYEEAADNCEDGASHCDLTDYTERHIASSEGESAYKYRQLAEWLKDLKKLRSGRSCSTCKYRYMDSIDYPCIYCNSSDCLWEYGGAQ